MQRPIEEKDFERELNLAKQLKNNYCDEDGEEMNSAKAAEILYEIGKIYRNRSPNKLSLIRCVGLFNAAVIRNPDNVDDIQRDIDEVCHHILQQAHATLQTEDLSKKAREVKSTFMELRKEVKIFLDSSDAAKIPANAENLRELEVNKISAIKRINSTITNKYKEIMKSVGDFCENLMGNPPCSYAIVGMGSLALNQVTPYSDFEHILILSDDENYESYLEYFRWYSVIFHTIILNMQETIVRSLYIKTLNDPDSNSPLGDWFKDIRTPRGVAFDSMMPYACKVPLGRTEHTLKKRFNTELIKPVSEMLNYLSSEANIKHGYLLADILTKTCFVCGSKELFQQFEDGAKNYLNSQPKQDIVKSVKKQVQEDLNNFSTRFRLVKLKLNEAISIKHFLYRSSTIFIAALGRMNGISKNSCFDIISEMARNKLITQNTAHHLLYAIAIACEMRLRIYMKNESQSNDSIDLKKDGIEKFLDIVGFASTISYFQITYCLQCEVAKQLNFTKLHFYSDPQLINITIGFVFDILGNFKLSSKDNQLKNARNLLEFDFDTCIEQLKKSNWLYGVTNTSKSIHLKSVESLAEYLYTTQVYDDALEFYDHILTHLNTKLNQGEDADIARIHYTISRCLSRMQEYKKALSTAEQSLKIYQNLSLHQKTDRDIAQSFQNVGFHLSTLHRLDEAKKYLEKSLTVWQNCPVKEDREIARTMTYYGNCLKKPDELDTALKYHKDALAIFERTSSDVNKDKYVAFTIKNLSNCLYDMKKFDEALPQYQKSLQILENFSPDKENDWKIAKRHRKIGKCLQQLHRFDEALKSFYRSLEITQNRSLDPQKDIRVSKILYCIGLCLLDMHIVGEALNYMQRSFYIFEQLPTKNNKEIYDKIITIGCKIIECLQKLGHENDNVLSS